MTVTAEMTDRLARIEAIVERLEAQRCLSPVVSLEDAMVLTRCRSQSAFYRWASAHRIKPCGAGRYSREKIMKALRKECR